VVLTSNLCCEVYMIMLSSCGKTECGVTCNLVQVTETVDFELLGHDEIEITNSDCQLRVK
jgi:hypothetical protein